MPVRQFRMVAMLIVCVLSVGFIAGEPALGQADKGQGKLPKDAPNKANPGRPLQPDQNPRAPGAADAAFQGDPHEIVLFKSIQWQHGPCLAKMRDVGQVQVPAGYKFTGEGGCHSIMELTRNLQNPNDVGLIAPSSFNPTDPNNNDWFLVFVWEAIGYVKDDEKAALDGDAIMKSLREGEVEANKERARRGFPSLTLVGWEQAPFYDPQTNNLTWATRAFSTINGQRGMETINYNSRLLGRGGVMSVELVIGPEQLQRELPKYKDIIQAYSFQPGQNYSEWRAGDKVAAYGLTALISGGAVAAAAKSGLLGKLGKFIVYIVIAVVAGVGTIFRKIFRRGDSSSA